MPRTMEVIKSNVKPSGVFAVGCPPAKIGMTRAFGALAQQKHPAALALAMGR